MRVEEHTFDTDRFTIGILSDSHGFTDPAVVGVMAKCDIAIHAGDIMAEVALDDVRRHTKTFAVAGNNDVSGLKRVDSKPATEFLPDVVLIKLPSGTIAVEHGHLHGFHQPDHQKLTAAHPDARAIIYGHTHVQLIDQSQVPWILNPGAAGHIRNYGGPKCLVLHIEADQWRVVTHNFESEPEVRAEAISSF